MNGFIKDRRKGRRQTGKNRLKINGALWPKPLWTLTYYLQQDILVSSRVKLPGWWSVRDLMNPWWEGQRLYITVHFFKDSLTHVGLSDRCLYLQTLPASVYELTLLKALRNQLLSQSCQDSHCTPWVLCCLWTDQEISGYKTEHQSRLYNFCAVECHHFITQLYCNKQKTYPWWHTQQCTYRPSSLSGQQAVIYGHCPPHPGKNIHFLSKAHMFKNPIPEDIQRLILRNLYQLPRVWK